MATKKCTYAVRLITAIYLSTHAHHYLSSTESTHRSAVPLILSIQLHTAMSATNNTLSVMIGGQCNGSYHLPAYSPSFSQDLIQSRGAITEDLCRGPGCVIQERSAVTSDTTGEADQSLVEEYDSRCTTAGGIWNLRSTVQGDGGAQYSIGYCAVQDADATDRVGQAMDGLERTGVWCSKIPARIGGAGRKTGLGMGRGLLVGMAALTVTVVASSI